MTDTAPLIFATRLGALHPQNTAARDALTALGNNAQVTVTVKRSTANHRRLALYWAMMHVAAENLASAVDGGLTKDDMHEIVKQKLGLGVWLTLPSGDRVFRSESIAFGKMSEPERAAFINRVDALLCKWLGVPVGSVFEAARREEA